MDTTTTSTTTDAPATDGTPSSTKPRRRRRKARGSIYKRSDGRWCAELALRGGGRKFIYGKTQGEVEQKLTAAKASIDNGVPLGDDRVTISHVLDRFLEERAGRVRPKTHARYREIVDLHIRTQLGAKRARALTAGDVQSFASAHTRDKMTPAMVHHVLVVLRMALNLAESWDLVARNVAKRVKAPKVDRVTSDTEEPKARSVREPLDLDDTRKLLTAAKAHRLGTIWILAACLGLRQSELLGLRWRDLDLEAATLTVRHQLAFVTEGEGEARTTRAILAPLKAKRRLAVLPLAPGLVALLRDRRTAQKAEKLKAGAAWENPLDLVFTSLHGHALDACRVHRVHRELLGDAGVRVVRFHDLRHGAATEMIGSGVDVASTGAVLGHKDLATTLRYTHPDAARANAAVARLAGTLGLG